MAAQNLVSASITPETKDEILRSLAEVRGKLGFLLTLQADERAGLFKAGKEYAPFLDECHKVARDHPEILPGVFNSAEFERDWQLAQDVSAIADTLEQLHEGVGHTLTAARSDALVAALDVYSAVKLNRDKVPGLNGVADTLGSYFKKSPKAARIAGAAR
jgi:hypothetical protein